MPKGPEKSIEQQLDTVIELLQCIVARDMARAGVTQQAIAKHLKKAKADVVRMVSGAKKGS